MVLYIILGKTSYTLIWLARTGLLVFKVPVLWFLCSSM